LFVLATALLLLSGAPTSLGAEDYYKLDTGDRLRVTVYGHEDLSGEFEVGGSGTVSLPLIGEVRASGLGAKQLEEMIIGQLKPNYLKNPSVTVEVLNYRPFFIIGEVKAPGSYPYVNGMRALNAVAIAGGYTYRAKKSKIYIMRAGDAQREKEVANPETLVLPGDVIEVPERFF
jgi:polysaccharide export outer membrane protein